MEKLYYVIAVGKGIKLGVLYSTHDAAEKMAKSLRLKYYEVIPYRVTKNA